MRKRLEKKVSKIKKLVAQAEGIREQIYDQILKIPESKDIKRLSKDPQCWQQGIKTLTADMVMSPSYYNFYIQASNVISYLEKQPISKFEQKLTEMTTPNSSGNYILKGQGYAYRLHPKFVKHLKKIIK